MNVITQNVYNFTHYTQNAARLLETAYTLPCVIQKEKMHFHIQNII